MLARMLFQIFATGELIRNYCYNVFVLQRFALSDNGIGVESNCQQKDLMASFLFNPVYHEGFADVLENLYPVIDLLLKFQEHCKMQWWGAGYICNMIQPAI
jgi:hypothetical protein